MPTLLMSTDTVLPSNAAKGGGMREVPPGGLCNAIKKRGAPVRRRSHAPHNTPPHPHEPLPMCLNSSGEPLLKSAAHVSTVTWGLEARSSAATVASFSAERDTMSTFNPRFTSCAA